MATERMKEAKRQFDELMAELDTFKDAGDDAAVIAALKKFTPINEVILEETRAYRSRSVELFTAAKAFNDYYAVSAGHGMGGAEKLALLRREMQDAIEDSAIDFQEEVSNAG